MNDENKKYLYLLLGYTGILLILFAVIRYMSIIHDTRGMMLAIFGAVCLGAFLDFVEKEIGITVKRRMISRIGAIVILLLLVFIVI